MLGDEMKGKFLKSLDEEDKDEIEEDELDQASLQTMSEKPKATMRHRNQPHRKTERAGSTPAKPIFKDDTTP